ncbi:MAG TPA: hypothetical protein VM532_16195 [Burkholderiales bacterium]|nr:hypothetical protein [Burkholderiales bacterium]
MGGVKFGQRISHAVFSVVITSLLVACGGGGGGGDQSSSIQSGDAVASNLTSQNSSNGNVLTLPLEVLGDGSPNSPVIAEANLGVESARLGSVVQLWFQCHRCGFYGAPEFEATSSLPKKVKASVRVLGGMDDAKAQNVSWIDITDATVKLADDERLHGGVNGGLYTTRISLALGAEARGRLVALPKYNRIQFRFNGTDGESNGFRILNVQLQDAGASNVGANTIQRFDPHAERDVSKIALADVDAGRTLWYAHGAIVKSSIVNRPLQAACASCHASNGRDLQYFNYSNNSIIQRSRFHGLSETQGRQIVAFLRSSLKDVPYVEKARPWNPPYQPGPGLDCTGASCGYRWSGGAGLEAVLNSPSDAVAALFGKTVSNPLNITQADVDNVMNANATMNAREIPIPLQFPDWNAWLPTVHPLDVWPTNTNPQGSFQAGAQFAGSGNLDPNGKYATLIAWLKSHKNPNGNIGDWSHLTPDQRQQIMANFTAFGWEVYGFLGGGRGNHIAASGQYGAQVGGANLQQRVSSTTTAVGPAGAFTTNAFIERAVGSLLHWNSVKQWELAQDYALEGDQRWFIGDKDANTGLWKGRGEAHGWPFNTPSVFYLAPHMVYQADENSSGQVTREWYTAWEANNIVASYYRSNQWYQLQMTINPGGQSGWVNFPMDWPYLTAFDEYLAIKVGSATPAAKAAQDSHHVRLLQARIKSAQYVNNDIPLYDPAQPNLVANIGRYGRAQTIKHLTTTNYLDTASAFGIGNSKFSFLDDLSPGVYLKVVNGSIRQFNTLYAQTAASAWRRCDPNNTQLGEPESISGFRYCLDVTRTPLGTNGDGTRFMNTMSYGITTEQVEQYGLWKATQLGADPVRLKVWSDWMDVVWP